ncbi:hypothetical protein HZ326_27632 [Fusarium oxysporum f. sp. albedinis]|nr:hypothetical protein HZ326_27632 [Fusarium oxysporum f. sp. albedinis]
MGYLYLFLYIFDRSSRSRYSSISSAPVVFDDKCHDLTSSVSKQYHKRDISLVPSHVLAGQRIDMLHSMSFIYGKFQNLNLKSKPRP